MQLPEEIIKMIHNLKTENEELKNEIQNLKQEIQEIQEHENKNCIQTGRCTNSDRSIKDNQFENL